MEKQVVGLKLYETSVLLSSVFNQAMVLRLSITKAKANKTLLDTLTNNNLST